jgi:hypothetical protein
LTRLVDSLGTVREDLDRLAPHPSFIWPETRVLAGIARYAEHPPAKTVLADADLISGLIVGAADHTVAWLDDLLRSQGKRRICLVLVLFPACPTRKEHLSQIVTLVEDGVASGHTLEVRLLPLADRVSDSWRRAALPPTVIQAHSTPTGQSFMSIGSVADAGYDDVIPGSLNFVFRPDDALRDAWRRWFQYTFSGAAPLDRATAEIPHLVPAQGDPEAARLWKAFEDSCQGREEASGGGPSVDAETGEVNTCAFHAS